MSILAIQVHYCEDGQHKRMWLDIDPDSPNSAKAISWTSDGLPAKPGGGGGSAQIPEGDPPGPCPTGGQDADPFCWWDGSDWVCSDL